MNLLFAIDRRCKQLLLECLFSVADRGGAERYDAYILHSDLTPEDWGEIADGVPETVTCRFIAVPERLFEGFPETKRYPRQIYYRLAAPQLLPPEPERILYLDVDITVINSLVPLYETPMDDAWFVACTHTAEGLTRFNQRRLGIDREQEVPYINTGVMLMALDRMREHMNLGAIRDYAMEKQRVLMLPDQDILTALYGDKVKLADSLRYNLSDRTLRFYNAVPGNQKRDLDWVRDNAVIIHYFGKNKPWKESYFGKLDVFYHENRRRREVWVSGRKNS